MTLDGAFTHLATLTTNRLCLRQMRIDDTDAVFAFKSDPKVTSCYGQDPHRTKEESKAWLQQRITDIGCRDALFWVLTLKEEDVAIGECCFWNFDPDFKCAEIGYELNSGYWNRGLMTEALTAVLNFGFDEMEGHRIEANPLMTNEGSKRLLLKLGFQLEGTLRERQYFQGRFVDQMYFGLLEKEWMDMKA
jgi:[ribosomal protein S5]-alanine N-acetyltransferase